MIVLRFSKNIQADIERGWSAYMGTWCETKDQVIATVGENADVRFDEQSKLWAAVHHDGLSCFEVCDAATDKDIAEIAKDIEWEGFGDQTIGKIRYIKSISPILHVLECRSTKKEL